MAKPTDRVTAFRLMMPRQFTKMLKLCARCGMRVRWHDEKRALWCPRCKREY